MTEPRASLAGDEVPPLSARWQAGFAWIERELGGRIVALLHRRLMRQEALIEPLMELIEPLMEELPRVRMQSLTPARDGETAEHRSP